MVNDSNNLTFQSQQDGFLNSSTSKYLIRSKRPSEKKAMTIKNNSIQGFRIHSANNKQVNRQISFNFDKYESQSRIKGHLGHEVQTTFRQNDDLNGYNTTSERVCLTTQNDFEINQKVQNKKNYPRQIRNHNTKIQQLQKNEEQQEGDQSILIQNIQNHYRSSIQILEMKQTQLDKMVGLLENYRVTGLRDKDMQQLREEFKRFQEETKTQIARQQMNSEIYCKESAQAHKLQSMTQKYESLRQKYDQLKEKNTVLKQKIDHTEQNNQTFLKENIQQKNNIQEQMRKIENLETRMSIVLNQQTNYITTDTLRKTISELLKENEQFKRVVFNKDRYIVKLKEQQSRLLEESQKLEKQASYWQKKGQLKQEQIEQNEQGKTSNCYQSLPKDLSFLEQNLNNAQHQILLDIELMGGKTVGEWSFQEPSKEKIKESMSLVANQYISHKQHNDKVHSLLLSLSCLSSLSSSELQKTIPSLINQHLSPSMSHLWLPDHHTGTYQDCQDNTCLIALPEQGLLNQAFLSLQPVECHQGSLLYHLGSTPVYPQQHSIMIPLVKQEQLLGVLEVTDSIVCMHEPVERYLITLLANAVGDHLQHNLDIQLVTNSIQDQLQLRECFIQLYLSHLNQVSFNYTLHTWIQKLFNCQGQILFIEGKQFVIHCNSTVSSYVISYGQSAEVYHSAVPKIIVSSSNHQHQVDLSCLSNVYYHPILNQSSQVIMIIQIPLRHSYTLTSQTQTVSPSLAAFASQHLSYRIQAFMHVVQSVYD